ncbi:MAG: protein kinase [Planctomycetota bacterium]
MAKRILCPKCRNKIQLPEGAPRNAVECPLCKVVLPVISPRRTDTDALVGKDFAHYHILSRIGQGAMAAVYLVKNLHLGRPAALKLLHTTVARATDVAAKRFLREAKSAARVEHPNVLSVYHVGQHEGRYFIEMQYADGGTLADLIEEKGRVDAHTAARLIRDAAAGIGAAHDRGIIHRDVKPGNIMQMKDGLVKVADFGLARLEDGSTELTADGIILGTPLYMSPEQVAGREADKLSDIYSLGVTFFELLTGQPPFDAATPAAVLYMHVYDPLPSIKEIAPETPDGICRIVERMTQKDPNARYASCAEAARDLDDALAGARQLAEAREPQAEAARQADFRMDVVKMFLTMARFAVVASGSVEGARSALLTKAQALGVPDAQAEEIIRQAAGEAGIPLRKAEAQAAPRATQVEVERADERRRERLSQFYSLLMRLAVLLTVMLVVGGVSALVYGLWHKTRKEEKVQKAEQAAVQTKGEKTFLIQSARQREADLDWQGAAERYRQALDVSNDEDVRGALAAVQSVLQAQDLEKEQKWDEAAAAYKAALGRTQNKPFVESRLDFITQRKAYESALADAEAARKEGRWDDALAAFTRAAGVADRVPSLPRLDQEIKEAKAQKAGEKAARERMMWLLDTCAQRKDPYALLAAVEAYLESSLPVHRAARDILEERKKQALSEIASSPKPLRVDDKAPCRRLKLKSGQAASGIFVGETATELTCRVVQPDKIEERIFDKTAIESVAEAAAETINKEQAAAILAQALQGTKTDGAYRALCLMGHLRAEFDKEIIPASADDRKQAASAFSEALHKAVAFCEEMCPACVGTGKTPCPKCKGEGHTQTPCERCRILTRLPLCDTCRGGGVRMTGVCKECRGRGKKICPQCKGKRCPHCDHQGRWECKQCRGTGKTETKLKCWECQGSGKVNDKPCPACFGRGKPRCTDCNGTGRKECPDCNGKKVVLRPCEHGEEGFTIRCAACRGAGKR